MQRTSIITLLTLTLILCIPFGIISPVSSDLPVIKQIVVTGNKLIKTETILHRLPYKSGGLFDKKKSGDAITSLYDINYFNQVVIEKESTGTNEIRLFVTVTEKPTLEKIVFLGNEKLRTKKLLEKIDAKKLVTIDQSHAENIARTIRKEYRENDYHSATVTPVITLNKKHKQKATLTLKINEGIRSTVRRVMFVGNKKIEGRDLRSFIISKESWLFGALSGAGKFDPDMLEADRQRIALLYRKNGYLFAQVTKTDIELSPDGTERTITFHIKEGDQYKISKIDTAQDDEIPHELLTRLFLLDVGDVYDEEKIYHTTQNLKKLWGEWGYIDADVRQQVVPDTDNKTVSLFFHTEKGSKWKLNRINITGNKKTHDSIIRRQILLEEGSTITTGLLDRSKNNVEYLSYFERDGVSWKKHRIDDGIIDLELNVKEALTRQINAGINYGAGKDSTSGGLRGMANVEIKNIGGQGIDAGFSLEGTFTRHPELSWPRKLARNLQKASFHVFDPHLFDSHVSADLSFAYLRDTYDQWKDVTHTPYEEIFSVRSRIGFPLPTRDRRTHLALELGLQDIRNNHDQTSTNPHKRIEPVAAHNKIYRALMQKKIDNTFQAGTLHWLGVDLIKDTRNHKVYPNDGYKLSLETKLALPALNHTFSFVKTEAHASWYTPLIGRDALVLGLHGYGGVVSHLRTGKRIPYRELFNLGGQNTIRGFNWGEVAPSFFNMPIGGTKALQFNAELIFPVLNNYNMKMHLFYDTGCSWDTPKDETIKQYPQLLKKNTFNLRHTIGIGLNILQPQPMKISFGYKLDRNKKLGESPHEFHIGMNAAF